MVRAARTFAVLVVALAVLASAEARRELLADSPSGSPSTSPAASTSPASPTGSTSPPASPVAAAAATATSPAPATQAAAAQPPVAAAQPPAAAAQTPAAGATAPTAAATAPATGPAAAQTPGSAPAPGQPGNTVINNNNNNNNNQQTSINPTLISNTNNNNNNNAQPAILQQGATFQPGPGASTAGPVVAGGALVAGPGGGGVASGGSQGGSSGGSSGGSPGPNNCPVTKDGLTVTEQFLAQICAAQSARYNGQYIASSLLQNSGGKTDNALICCAACLDSSTCTAWNFQASGQPAYDGTPSGACQLVSGTKGASDTLASGSGQPFIGGVLAKTSP